MGTKRRLVFTCWQKTGMFAELQSGLDWLNGSVSGSWSRFKRHLRLNKPLTYFSYDIVAETDLHEVIWQVAVCEISVSSHGLFPCSRTWWSLLCFCWVASATIQSQDTVGVLFPMKICPSNFFWRRSFHEITWRLVVRFETYAPRF